MSWTALHASQLRFQVAFLDEDLNVGFSKIMLPIQPKAYRVRKIKNKIDRVWPPFSMSLWSLESLLFCGFIG